MLSRSRSILSLRRLSALLLLAVLILLNVVAARSSSRIDLTEDGLYTLTDASKRVLSTLEDPASIRVFWHKVPGSQAETQRRYIDSLLLEMKAVAEGRLSVRWVDLESEDGKQEAEDAGVQTFQYQAREEGEVRATEGYSSLIIEVGDKKEPVPQLLEIGPRFEYEVVSRLQRMTRTDDLTLALVVKRPPMNPFGGAQTGRFNAIEYFLREHLGTGLRSHLSLDEPVPPDVDVLLVVGPQDFEEQKVYHFEQFLLRGGKAMLLVDPVHAPLLQAPPGQAESSGFEEWFAHLGLTVESGVVGDFRSFQTRPRRVRTRIGTVEEWIQYPYWPLLRTVEHEDENDRRGVNQDNPATRGFDQVPLHWPAAISIDEARHAEAKRQVTVLAATSEAGYRRQDLIGLDHGEEDARRLTEAELESAIPLMVHVEGPMTSFWKGRPAPGEDEAKEGDDEAEPEGEEPAEPEEEGPPRLDEGKGLFVLLTDAEIIDDGVARLNGGAGFGFVINLVDWLGGSEELLALRAREPTPRTIEKVEPETQTLLTWINLSVVPLFVLLAGIVVFIVRRYPS